MVFNPFAEAREYVGRLPPEDATRLLATMFDLSVQVVTLDPDSPIVLASAASNHTVHPGIVLGSKSHICLLNVPWNWYGILT
jgi:hypothetical protein